MTELIVQYCYSLGQWGLYYPAIDDIVYVNQSLEKVVSYAYELADMLKPCAVRMIPQYFLNSYTLDITA